MSRTKTAIEKKPSNWKSGYFTFVLYEESQSLLLDYVQHNWPCATCVHDLDVKEDGTGELKKVHAHVFVAFENPRWASAVAKELDSLYPDIRFPMNALEKVASPYAAYHYLWHDDSVCTNCVNKVKYDSAAVFHNSYFVPPKDKQGCSEDEQVGLLFEAPYGEFPTIADFGRWAYDNGCYASFRKNYGFWKDCYFAFWKAKKGLSQFD